MSIFNKILTIDFGNVADVPEIKLVQGEAKARVIHLRLSDTGAAVNLTGCTARIYILPYGETTPLYEDLTVVSASAGKVDYTVSGNAAAIAGSGKFWIEIIQTGSPDPLSVGYSREGKLTVAEKQDFTGAIIASTVFSALQDALASAQTYLSRIVALETTDQDHAGRIVALETEILDPAPLVGEIKMWPGTAAPPKFAICDGTAVSRTTYAALFAVLGTLYGAGDGSTTFNLPNLKGRVPVGYDSSQTAFDALGETGGEKTHTLTINEMPNHNHGISSNRNIYYSSTGTVGLANSPAYGAGIDAEASVPQGGNAAHNNLQPYIVVNYIIRAVE